MGNHKHTLAGRTKLSQFFNSRSNSMKATHSRCFEAKLPPSPLTSCHSVYLMLYLPSYYEDTRINGKLPKSQLTKRLFCKKVNLKKMPSKALGHFMYWLTLWRIDFLANWLFGELTFCRLTNFPSIALLWWTFKYKTRVNKKACGKHSIGRARDEETKSYVRFRPWGGRWWRRRSEESCPSVNTREIASEKS